MSKYRIMFLLSKKENLNDLYKFDTTEIDGEVFYREFSTLEEADAYIETLLNQQGYSKEDILLVREKEFNVCIKTEDSGTGESGQDGFSPIAKVVQTETGVTITITDKTGTTTATVNNGKDGKDGIDGTDGTNGADGFSPSIAESAGNNDTVYKLDITNKTGKITTPNLKGADGADGAPGDKGDTGTSIKLKGAWTASTEYVNNNQYIDIVTYDGNTYGCKTSHTSGDSWDVTNWVLLASKGSKGDTGEKGATGEKGETGANGTDGQDGAPGVSAGFGTPTATVDNNVGVPSVAVTATGEDTAKVFNFEFKNLKGEKGEKGDKGDTGATGTNGTDGKSITAITLTKDSTGAITGGTATLSDQSQVPITITIEETT